MVSSLDTTIDRLREEERLEVESTLKTRHSQFHSDQGESIWALWVIAAPILAIAVVAVFAVFGPSEIVAYFEYAPMALPRSLISPILGQLIAMVLLPIAIWRIVALHKKCGWMVTEFGLVRVRGQNLRIARWTDVELVERYRVNASGSSSGFYVVALHTPAGKVVMNSGALWDLIRARLPNVPVKA